MSQAMEPRFTLIQILSIVIGTLVSLAFVAERPSVLATVGLGF